VRGKTPRSASFFATSIDGTSFTVNAIVGVWRRSAGWRPVKMDALYFAQAIPELFDQRFGRVREAAGTRYPSVRGRVGAGGERGEKNPPAAAAPAIPSWFLSASLPAPFWRGIGRRRYQFWKNSSRIE